MVNFYDFEMIMEGKGDDVVKCSCKCKACKYNFCKNCSCKDCKCEGCRCESNIGKNKKNN